ncbi:uncharacterized protein LOC110906695 isoform X1 [Helianthus annuus]|uniref:uncharacterized protein LOC110906695 isoform X1 n=1 Tax=Helianthus annuus TaxID=4232 RepID=UPI001652D220|nr:uncharacterized protein LOC110906695 isoform X1 [Helianthus annuus]
MALTASVVMIYIGMMMLLLCVPDNHAKMTEYSPAPQPQPSGNSSMSVHQDAHIGARKPPSRSHACFFAKSVVPHACAYLPGPMGTNNIARVTTHGRPREEAQNALDSSLAFLFRIFNHLFRSVFTIT